MIASAPPPEVPRRRDVRHYDRRPCDVTLRAWSALRL